MGKFFIWKVHAEFSVHGIKVKSVVSGPSADIYTALGDAKICLARNIPNLDTRTVFFNFVEASQKEIKDILKGWKLEEVCEV